MSRNTELVGQVLEAWNRRDMATVERFITDDFQWVDHEDAPEDQGKTNTGVAAIEAMTQDLDDSFEAYTAELLDMVDVGDAGVVVVLRETAKGAASGAEVSTDFGYLVTLRGDVVAKIEVFRDPRGAFSAAEKLSG